MNARLYLKVSAINLCFLLAGILVWQVVSANTWQLHAAHAQDQPASRNASAAPSTDFEYVTPSITYGVGGFNQVIARQVAADEIMAQGVDLLKLHEATLNLLITKKVATVGEVQRVINGAKVERPLRIRPLQ
jgi:hypothetical protein